MDNRKMLRSDHTHAKVGCFQLSLDFTPEKLEVGSGVWRRTLQIPIKFEMPACSSVVMIKGYLYLTSGFNRHLFPKQGLPPRLDFMIYYSPSICRENPKKTVTAEAKIVAFARFIGTNYRRLFVFSADWQRASAATTGNCGINSGVVSKDNGLFVLTLKPFIRKTAQKDD